MEYTESTRPRNNKELFYQSIKLYRLVFNKVIGLAVILSLISFIPQMMDFWMGRNFFEVLPAQRSNLLILLIDFVCLILFITILERFELTIEKKRDKLNRDFVLSLRKFPTVFLGSLIVWLFVIFVFLSFLSFFVVVGQLKISFSSDLVRMFLIVIPFLFQILIMVYIFFSFYFYMPLIVTENFGVFASLGRSFKLVWGNWWRVLKLQVTPFLCYAIVIIFLRYGLNINIHLFYTSLATTNIFALIVHFLVFTMFIPLFASTILVQLHDLELRYKLNSKPKHIQPKKKLLTKKAQSKKLPKK